MLSYHLLNFVWLLMIEFAYDSSKVPMGNTQSSVRVAPKDGVNDFETSLTQNIPTKISAEEQAKLLVESIRVIYS